MHIIRPLFIFLVIISRFKLIFANIFLIFFIFFANYLFISQDSNAKHTINEPKIHLIILCNHKITLFILLFDLNTKHFLIKVLTYTVQYNSSNLQSLIIKKSIYGHYKRLIIIIYTIIFLYEYEIILSISTKKIQSIILCSI